MESEELTFEQQKTKVRKKLKRETKAIGRSLTKTKEQLDQAANWEKLHHQALLLQANLYQYKEGMQELICDDWETETKITFHFDKKVSIHEYVRNLFKKAKKAKLGVEPLTIQTAKLEGKLNEMEQVVIELEEVEDKKALNNFCQSHDIAFQSQERAKKPLPKKPYREFTSQEGVTIWVGKSASDNDTMTFHYANGNDWWLHVHDYPGSHVIIRLRGEEPSTATLEDAVQLAIGYSQAKDRGRVDVIMTQCKNVRPLKGAKGRVTLTKHHLISGDFDCGQFRQLTTNTLR